jgi:hypothetical protein
MRDPKCDGCLIGTASVVYEARFGMHRYGSVYLCLSCTGAMKREG